MLGSAAELESHSERGLALTPAWSFDIDGHLYSPRQEYLQVHLLDYLVNEDSWSLMSHKRPRDGLAVADLGLGSVLVGILGWSGSDFVGVALSFHLVVFGDIGSRIRRLRFVWGC